MTTSRHSLAFLPVAPSLCVTPTLEVSSPVVLRFKPFDITLRLIFPAAASSNALRPSAGGVPAESRQLSRSQQDLLHAVTIKVVSDSDPSIELTSCSVCKTNQLIKLGTLSLSQQPGGPGGGGGALIACWSRSRASCCSSRLHLKQKQLRLVMTLPPIPPFSTQTLSILSNPFQLRSRVQGVNNSNSTPSTSSSRSTPTAGGTPPSLPPTGGTGVVLTTAAPAATSSTALTTVSSPSEVSPLSLSPVSVPQGNSVFIVVRIVRSSIQPSLLRVYAGAVRQVYSIFSDHISYHNNVDENGCCTFVSAWRSQSFGLEANRQTLNLYSNDLVTGVSRLWCVVTTWI